MRYQLPERVCLLPVTAYYVSRSSGYGRNPADVAKYNQQVSYAMWDLVPVNVMFPLMYHWVAVILANHATFVRAT